MLNLQRLFHGLYLPPFRIFIASSSTEISIRISMRWERLSETGMRVLPISICSPLRCLRTSPTSWQSMQIPPSRTACICQDWDKKNFIFFCTYSIKPLLIFKVQNSLLLLTFSLLPIEEASSFFTTGFLYYSFCLLHCISDKVLTLKHNLYVFVVVNEHLINYV